MADRGDGEVGLSVAAAARRLGVAPATLRTWDRRYGLGPARRGAGEHRRYSGGDVLRLEQMLRLLVQGVSAGDAARAVAASPTQSSAGPQMPSAAAAGMGVRPRAAGDAARRLGKAVGQFDVDRVMALLAQAVAEGGVADAWEVVLRPTLAALGDRWAADGSSIAEEHLLSECATGVFHQVIAGRAAAVGRPVLLLSAPGEAHVLPLHALAAALAERCTPIRLLGAWTPHEAAVTAARMLQPAGIVIWAQSSTTADPRLFTGLPRARGGCRRAAAGPGWHSRQLPERVSVLESLTQAVDLLASVPPLDSRP